MKPYFEQVKFDSGHNILSYTYEEENFWTPWHFHPQHELNYVETSFGTKFIGDYVGPYEPGELVLMRSNLPHCWKNYVEHKIPASSIVVQWNKGIFAKIPEIAPVFEMLSIASKGIVFKGEQLKPIIPLLKKLQHLSGPEKYVLLLDLLVKLSQLERTTLSETSFKDDLPTEYGTRITKIHDFIEKNYSRKIYLRELADLVSMSEQSFSRFFTKTMGRSFFNFLSEYRINMAGRMLIDSDWSVGQIAFKSGYESMPSFYRQFNKFKGVSPSEFRKIYAANSGKF